MYFHSSYVNVKCLYCRSDVDEKDELVMEDIRKCMQKIGKSSVETTAYFRALGAAKGLNMQKFRKEVEEEVDIESGEKGFWTFHRKIFCILHLGALFKSVHLQLNFSDSSNADSSSASSELIPYDAPLYQNQLQDPNILDLFNAQFE